MPSASKSRSPVEVETVRDEGQVQDRDREADDAGDDDGETGEEEYEIEKILYHEEGVYTPVSLGAMVVPAIVGNAEWKTSTTPIHAG